MIFHKYIAYFVFCEIFIITNETELKTEEIGTSELSICENSTSDCYSEQVTDQVSLFYTESPSEFSTVPTVVTQPTANIKTTTNTSSVPLGADKRNDFSSSEDHCSCDITVGVCNINCCCDMDCNKWERDAFLECIMTKPIPTVGHCISTTIIYKNNTSYRIVKSEDGFFCISKDNFPERNWFLEQGIIKSERVFEKVWQRNRHYSWRILHPSQFIKFGKKDVYKYGDPLWVIINSTNTVQQMAYPAPLASSACGQNKLIFYLQNFESQCLENVPMSEEQCLHYSGKYYSGQVLIASPSLINNTYNLNEISDEAFITVKYLLCGDNECNEVDSLPALEFDSLTYVCKNVITSLHLQINHNGSQGITQAQYRVGLSSTDPQTPLFQRKFKVEFLPAHQSNSSVVFKRSGTPGYRIGLPVITGSLQDGKVVKKNYLTVVSGPNCSQSTNILFGENSRTQCILQIPLESARNCTRLSEEIAKILLVQRNGDMIGANGDPDTWLKRPVPIPVNLWHMAAYESCSVSTSLSTDFLYSYSGSLWQPQANIIGVSSHLSGQRFIECSTSFFFCSIRLLSIVSFTDVSQPALSKFATPPVVKIKLPQDFFYPFSSPSCVSVIKCSPSMVFFILVSALIINNL